MSSIDKRVIDVEQSCAFINKQFETQTKELKSAKKEIESLDKSCKNLKSSIRNLEQENSSMTDKISELEFRSMRDNLIFYGIPENDPKTEDCHSILKTFIQDNLHIDANDITFDRAHRLGGPNSKSPRPVIAKFDKFQDRERVRSASFEYKADLNTKRLGVGIQLPKEWRSARKDLYPVQQDAQKQGKSTRFSGNKLYINGQLYQPKT